MTKSQLRKSYEREIKKIVASLKVYNPQKIILFGSAARGKIHPESDIDICFVKENIDPLKTKRLLRELLWQAGFTWEREPDIHIYDSKVYRDWLARGDPFISEIEKGKTLYAR